MTEYELSLKMSFQADKVAPSEVEGAVEESFIDLFTAVEMTVNVGGMPTSRRIIM